MSRGALFSALATLALAAGEPLTLSQALREAGRTSLPAVSAGFSTEAAQAEEARARAAWWPEIQLQGGYRLLGGQPALLSQPIALGSLQIGPFQTPPLVVAPQAFPMEETRSWRYRLSVQTVLWDFGRRSRAQDAAAAGTEATRLRGESERRRAEAEAAARYLALMDLKAQRRVADQRRAALENHRAAVQALFEHGVVARNDLLRTEVALRRVIDGQQALRAAEASAGEALNVALGRPADAALQLPDALPPPPLLPWDEVQCRARASAANEGVRALEARVRALVQQSGALRSDRLPIVMAEASHAYAQNRYLVDDRENALFLGLSWKVFDGGARAAKVRRSEAEAALARRELLEARRQAETAAAVALRAFHQALREAETAEANTRAAEENLRIVGDQYGEGLMRTTDVLDAEAILAESRSAQAERRSRAFAQQAALLALLGEDLPAFYDRLPVPEP